MGRTLLCLMLSLAASGPADAADYALEPAGSTLKFIAVQQGAKFESRFKTFTADVHFDPASPGSGRIIARIDLGSVDTGNPERDAVLETADWFAISQWPAATFTAGRMVPEGAGFRAEGTLTLRDVSGPVTLHFRWTPATAARPARLKGSASLERLVFGVGQGDWRDTSYVGNAVEVQVDVQLREMKFTDNTVSRKDGTTNGR